MAATPNCLPLGRLAGLAKPAGRSVGCVLSALVAALLLMRNQKELMGERLPFGVFLGSPISILYLAPQSWLNPLISGRASARAHRRTRDRSYLSW